jgi:phosphatidylglycerol lysyltransferase
MSVFDESQDTGAQVKGSELNQGQVNDALASGSITVALTRPTNVHLPFDWPAALPAIFTFISGLAATCQPLLVRLNEHHPRLFNTLVSFEYYHLSNSLTIAFGYALLFLSLNLYKRKRRAWWIAISLTTLSAALQFARIGTEHIHWLSDMALARELPSYSVVPPLISISVLLATRKYFTVKSARATFRHALRLIVISLLAVLLYGILGFWLLDKRDFGLNFEIDQSILRTLKELTFVGNSDLTAHTKFGLWFIESLRLYGALAFLGIAMSAFRPLQYVLVTGPKERELAAQILDQHGRTALDIFKLLPDKSYFFGKDNDSFVAYKTELGVAIALGDPTCAAAKMDDLLTDYLNLVHENGWKAAFLQTTPDFLPLYKKHGLKAVKVGEDGLVDIAQFMAKTINKKGFKSAIKKFDKDGYKLVRYQAPHSSALLDEMELVSKAWLALPGRRERGFSLGKFERSDLQHNDIFVLRDKDDKAIAFVNQIRSYRPGEVTIDMMRHIESAPNGSMDYLFAKLISDLSNSGFKYFSLGLAALSGVGETPDSSLEEKALHQVYEHLNRFFSYKGLRAYKNKFDPTWEDRFLVYEGAVPGLARAGLAIARATEE